MGIIAFGALPRARRLELQARLRDLGYYEGALDAIIGPRTRAALWRYLEEELPQEPKVIGGLTLRTALALGIDVSEMRQAVALAARTAARRPPDGLVPLVIEYADLTPAQRETLQRRLADLGYYEGLIDAIIGPETRAALRRFSQKELPTQPPVIGGLTATTAAELGLDVTEIVPVGGRD